MLRVLKVFIFILILFFLSSVIILATIGIETDKLNNFTSKKISQVNNKLNIKLNKIKFKFDIKELSIFLETTNPTITFRENLIPADKIKVYIDFFSLIKTSPQIKKINIASDQIDISEVKDLSKAFKPSNLKDLINNKIEKGKLELNIEFFLSKENTIENFIATGRVIDLEARLREKFQLTETNFNFFADKTDILIKNIFGKIDLINISDGDLRIDLSEAISINSNFLSDLKFKGEFYKKYNKLFPNLKFFENVNYIDVNLNNNLSVYFDKTYKIKKFDFNSVGKAKKIKLNFNQSLQNKYFNEEIKKIELNDTSVKINLSPEKKITSFSGNYALNNEKKLNYRFNNEIVKDLLKLDFTAQVDQKIELDILNYVKPRGSIANISVNLDKTKKNIKFNKISYKESNNSILLENLIYNNKIIKSFKKISVKTFKDKKINNDFSINSGNKIRIKGSNFDASNLAKQFKKKSNNKLLEQINKEIEIDFENIFSPLSNDLKNFKLIGSIKNGKFEKILSKGDFGGGKFLDISMKNDKNKQLNILEIYSDFPQPLISEYSFFQGLIGGTLLFTSNIQKDLSKSKLKIENFKVKNAPNMVKLLSLADLGGLADLAEGQGISFDTLEINMINEKGFLKFDEIYALGPSISVLMEGYQDKNGLTSLRGTLVPAKTLNKLLSKIPLIGDIIIPKEIGEGFFGISFKMKGMPGKIKTTINPIRTVTPRFIQKIIDKNKNAK